MFFKRLNVSVQFRRVMMPDGSMQLTPDSEAYARALWLEENKLELAEQGLSLPTEDLRVVSSESLKNSPGGSAAG